MLQTRVVAVHLALKVRVERSQTGRNSALALLTTGRKPLPAPAQEFAHSVCFDQFLTESGCFSGTEVVLMGTGGARGVSGCERPLLTL